MSNTQKTLTAGLTLPLMVMSVWASGQATTPGSTSTTCLQQTVSVGSTYQDGAYTARGWYGSLPSSITVTVTLKDDVIQAVKVQTHATDPTSLDLQRRFAAAVPKIVVGRPIACVQVGKLAGSSGTPNGFNAALKQIKEQAAK